MLYNHSPHEHTRAVHSRPLALRMLVRMLDVLHVDVVSGGYRATDTGSNGAACMQPAIMIAITQSRYAISAAVSKVRPIGLENHDLTRSARRGAVGGEGGAQGLEAPCHKRANRRRATKGNAFQNKQKRVTRRTHTKERRVTAGVSCNER
jgi:hypothetical protein